jgi:hypothetical protein
MDEHVLAAIITNDEAEALLSVEEFNDARAFANDLSRHATTPAAAAAKTAAAAAETAAATAAEAAAITAAETTAAAAAEAITAAKTATVATEASAAEAVTTAAAAVEIVIAETVALVLAAPAAATSVKTHALLFTFASPKTITGQACRANDMQNPPRTSGLGLTISTFPGSANDLWRIAAAFRSRLPATRQATQVQLDEACDCDAAALAIEGDI